MTNENLYVTIPIKAPEGMEVMHIMINVNSPQWWDVSVCYRPAVRPDAVTDGDRIKGMAELYTDTLERAWCEHSSG